MKSKNYCIEEGIEEIYFAENTEKPKSNSGFSQNLQIKTLSIFALLLILK